jgi:hypothetical protein
VQKKQKNKNEHHSKTMSWKTGNGLMSLPNELLQHILKEVLKEGDHKFYLLSLVCKKMKEIVMDESFRRVVHYAWLNSVLNWSDKSIEFKKQYYVMYEIKSCFQCGRTYKEMNGLIGCGKFGVLNKFYSDISNPGFCSHECCPHTE